jgi:ubiquitin carboxyl-terminal hydrolase 4/11/15
MVSTGAYLLFYRRRSDGPLGGPRFESIVNRYNNPSQDDEDSGEDQRLDADSSHRGSSSALTGAGAVHPVSGSGVQETINPSGLLPSPAFQQNRQGGTQMVRSREITDLSEEDEAVDLGPTTFGAGAWNFDALGPADDGVKLLQPSEAGSTFASPPTSGASYNANSDMVDHGSDVDEFEKGQRIADWNNAEVDAEYVEQPGVPDLDEDQQVGLIDLQDVKAARRGGDGQDAVAEIHIEEGEGLHNEG